LDVGVTGVDQDLVRGCCDVVRECWDAAATTASMMLLLLLLL